MPKTLTETIRPAGTRRRRKIETAGNGRRCGHEHCTVKLSIYNLTDRCAAHPVYVPYRNYDRKRPVIDRQAGDGRQKPEGGQPCPQ